jgi:hypothetical protein
VYRVDPFCQEEASLMEGPKKVPDTCFAEGIELRGFFSGAGPGPGARAGAVGDLVQFPCHGAICAGRLCRGRGRRSPNKSNRRKHACG